MADNSASIQASVRSVFPNARFLNCWFHVQHNLRKKKTKRKIPDQFLQEVRILHYAPTPEVTAIARQKFEDFWGTKNPTVFNVFRDEYLEEGKDQWVNTCAPAGVHMTNNGTERYNQRMKTDWVQVPVSDPYAQHREGLARPRIQVILQSVARSQHQGVPEYTRED